MTDMKELRVDLPDIVWLKFKNAASAEGLSDSKMFEAMVEAHRTEEAVAPDEGEPVEEEPKGGEGK